MYFIQRGGKRAKISGYGLGFVLVTPGEGRIKHIDFAEFDDAIYAALYSSLPALLTFCTPHFLSLRAVS